MSYYVITEPCVGTCDTACVDVCPVDCIHGPLPIDELQALKIGPDSVALASMSMFIDPEICIDCGVCVEPCPVDAIFEKDDVPSQWSHYIKLNAQFFE